MLFIDEAYSITENDNADSYGRECLTELTKALEDYRNDLVVIVAGYTDPMKKFFLSNPGLKSRFNTFIEFDDYDERELFEILLFICKKNNYVLSKEAKEKLQEFFANETHQIQEGFSNGRFVRNLFDKLVLNHARRVAQYTTPTKEELSIIRLEDI